MELEREDIKKSLRDNKLNKMDRKTVELLRSEIEGKLEILAKIYGIKLSLGRIHYDDLGFRTQLRAKLQTTELGISAEQLAFERLCWRYKFDKEDYGKEVVFPSGKFRGVKGRITGFNTRAKRYPIVVTREDGNGIIRSTPGSILSLIGKRP